MKSSVSASGKVSPLRSNTFLLPSLKGSQRTGAGYTSIRLDTYHDTSDLRAALRKIEAAFLPVEQEAVASATANVSTAIETIKATVDVPLQNVGDGAPSRPAVVATKRSAAMAPTLPGSVQPAISKLSPQLVIYCFSFCNLRTLGVLCMVSVRMNVIVGSQGTALWLAAAHQRRIPIAVPARAREELRVALVQRARERHAEEAYYESEIARMEERLSVRAQDIYAQNVDVDLTLRTNGGSSMPAASRSVRLGLRQQLLARAKACAAVDSADTAPAAPSPSAETCAKLEREIEALEEMKRTCECRLNLQEELLRQQDAQLRQWQSLLVPCKVSESEPSLACEAAGAATVSSRSENGSAAATVPHPALVSAAEVDEFERRIARLVLNGCESTSLAERTGAPAGGARLPPVLRRGVENFASLELVLRALGCGEPHNGLHPTNQGSVLTGNVRDAATASTPTASAPGGAVRAAAKRWDAFQKVCPPNEEYEKARLFLKAQALQAGPAPTPRAQSGAGGRSPVNVANQSRQRPSAKQMAGLLRLSSFVRRVEAMSDAQVLREWM
ncbi:hypothetical protein LSCM1_02180 [Leishmania martiniquensis]|uniref:Uncharacterized protein n=1 Tax=Leishmania martiniquensis TaxID=1580590 RepID=A0A836G9W9_9TRYP|nr:hypothetical protein LSCM1_02180 [Leishmania martiniquensis]